jgi:hypothetical protein
MRTGRLVRSGTSVGTLYFDPEVETESDSTSKRGFGRKDLVNLHDFVGEEV